MVPKYHTRACMPLHVFRSKILMIFAYLLTSFFFFARKPSLKDKIVVIIISVTKQQQKLWDVSRHRKVSSNSPSNSSCHTDKPFISVFQILIKGTVCMFLVSLQQPIQLGLPMPWEINSFWPKWAFHCLVLSFHINIDDYLLVRTIRVHFLTKGMGCKAECICLFGDFWTQKKTKTLSEKCIHKAKFSLWLQNHLKYSEIWSLESKLFIILKFCL